MPRQTKRKTRGRKRRSRTRRRRQRGGDIGARRIPPDAVITNPLQDEGVPDI